MKIAGFTVLLLGVWGCAENPPQADKPMLKSGAAPQRYGAEAATNHLSIHLVTDRAGWIYGTNPQDLKVEGQPILSDADFLTFDTNHHTFTLTTEAVNRLGMTPHTFESLGERFAAWDGRDTPFVLRASGEPIYAGVFDSLWSSASHLDVPVIVPIDGPFIPIDSFSKAVTNVAFRIELEPSWPPQGVPPPWAWLSTWQILEHDLGKPDVRDDPRIIRAVQELFAHEERVNKSRTNGLSQ